MTNTNQSLIDHISPFAFRYPRTQNKYLPLFLPHTDFCAFGVGQKEKLILFAFVESVPLRRTPSFQAAPEPPAARTSFGTWDCPPKPKSPGGESTSVPKMRNAGETDRKPGRSQ